MDGQFNFSAFTGAGVDTASVTIPVQIDAPRRTWVKIFEMQATDSSMTLAFQKLGFQATAGGSLIIAQVKVD